MTASGFKMSNRPSNRSYLNYVGFAGVAGLGLVAKDAGLSWYASAGLVVAYYGIYRLLLTIADILWDNSNIP